MAVVIKDVYEFLKISPNATIEQINACLNADYIRLMCGKDGKPLEEGELNLANKAYFDIRKACYAEIIDADKKADYDAYRERRLGEERMREEQLKQQEVETEMFTQEVTTREAQLARFIRERQIWIDSGRPAEEFPSTFLQREQSRSEVLEKGEEAERILSGLPTKVDSPTELPEEPAPEEHSEKGDVTFRKRAIEKTKRFFRRGSSPTEIAERESHARELVELARVMNEAIHQNVEVDRHHELKMARQHSNDLVLLNDVAKEFDKQREEVAEQKRQREGELAQIREGTAPLGIGLKHPRELVKATVEGIKAGESKSVSHNQDHIRVEEQRIREGTIPTPSWGWENKS